MTDMNDVQRFRKKPVVVEAMKYRHENRGSIIAWSGARHTYMDDDGALRESASLFINTTGGEVRAMFGDWIIRGVMGEFYPCTNEVFEATYEPAE